MSISIVKRRIKERSQALSRISGDRRFLAIDNRKRFLAIEQEEFKTSLVFVNFLHMQGVY